MNNPTTPLRTSNSDVSSKRKGFTNRPNVVTSTPRRKLARNSQFPYSDDGMLEVYAGDAEALPHVHKGHYFNVMNVFGLGGGKCEYSLANSTADNSFYTPIIKSHSRDRKGNINYLFNFKIRRIINIINPVNKIKYSILLFFSFQQF